MASSTQAEPRPKRVLVVDDEPDVVSYLEMPLRDSGYETLTAVDGTEALDKVRSEHPDLVTLDISMPKASGTRFYREVKTDPDLAPIPVAIVTAVTGYGGDAHAYEKFISNRKLVPPRCAGAAPSLRAHDEHERRALHPGQRGVFEVGANRREEAVLAAVL